MIRCPKCDELMDMARPCAACGWNGQKPNESEADYKKLASMPSQPDQPLSLEIVQRHWVGTPATGDAPKWYWISVRVFLLEDENGFWTANAPDSDPEAWHPICVLRTVGCLTKFCEAIGVKMPAPI